MTILAMLSAFFLLQSSPLYNIQTTYGNAATGGIKLSNSVAFKQEINMGYTYGTSLTDGNIWNIVQDAFNLYNLPQDTSAVYFVLTAPDVTLTSGFCTQYCGWHTVNTANRIKYSFVGNSKDKCLTSCSYQTIGPNGDAGVDAMASVYAHELEEAASDPELNAWYDSQGNEVRSSHLRRVPFSINANEALLKRFCDVTYLQNADKCAWTFGTMYTAANGAKANVKLGSRDFLIQQNWVNDKGGYCALSYASTAASPPPPPPSLSPPPPPPSLSPPPPPPPPSLSPPPPPPGTSNVYFADNFDIGNAKGWNLGAEWAIGVTRASTCASGGLVGYNDPATDHTSSNTLNGVAGVVIGGCGTTGVHGFYYLTSPAIDTSAAPSTLWLNFWRWEVTDYSTYRTEVVEVSITGSTWTTLYTNSATSFVRDSSWVQVSYDLSNYKSKTMMIRFGAKVVQGLSYKSPSWSIDDLCVADSTAACTTALSRPI